MSDAHIPPSGGKVPKLGRVNEICQEWMVREDGAIAYHLQNQEIRQHYSGNKQRNALVREDYPTAKSEQQKEQELAEQAAAVYRRMLEEQEEVDKMLAERLTQKLEFEEKMRKKAEEMVGLHVAKKLQDELVKPPVLRQLKPNKDAHQLFGNLQMEEKNEHSTEAPFLNRDAKPLMDFPHPSVCSEPISEGSSIHKTQEETDAELARMLQEQEGNPEECILERDRLLAIEAQDKELAKVLQERERMKAKKAKERAKQKALVKRQQKRSEGTMSQDVILPDDAYSNPRDMISPHTRSTGMLGPMNGMPQPCEEYEDNYSLPVDGLDSIRSAPECSMPEYPNYIANKGDSPKRPSHLNIRPTYKPRFPDPEDFDRHSNIAIAIDPTYAKQEGGQSPGTYSQHWSPARSVSSKSSRSSPSSSSSKEPDGKLEINNAPPYMPIQGQKRTATSEKRRVRDGCKQQ